tara:strand:+ start:135 stop:419 length:285 start_codon:yes stop_codon:yes gene_type:complete
MLAKSQIANKGLIQTAVGTMLFVEHWKATLDRVSIVESPTGKWMTLVARSFATHVDSLLKRMLLTQGLNGPTEIAVKTVHVLANRSPIHSLTRD